MRDTLRVAIADLGTGPANSFTNNGTLALPAVTGATTLDSTGQYLPQGNALNAMALGGPVQGQIVGASSFVNSGVINLQANPVPGDVLVITGARTAGSFGSGNFVANGGSLRLELRAQRRRRPPSPTSWSWIAPAEVQPAPRRSPCAMPAAAAASRWATASWSWTRPRAAAPSPAHSPSPAR